jgi:hypothetical protein
MKHYATLSLIGGILLLSGVPEMSPVLAQGTTDKKDPAVAKDQKPTPVATASPKVDLRPEFEKFKLDVRDQGARGSCQVFAMVGMIEYQLARRGTPVKLSEQFIMWAANEANRLKRTGGFNPDLLITGLKQYGICEESLMPYIPAEEAIEKPSAEALKDARIRTQCKIISIKHWTTTIGFADKEHEGIIRQLDAGTPITATFCWPAAVRDDQLVDAQHFMIDKNIDGKSKSGHGVILVGYGLDDKMAGGGYFIFRNSWSPKFADKGYARITFEFARKYRIDAYIVSQATTDPLDGYRPEGIAAAVKLRDSLAGTVWFYTYSEKNYEFAFGKSGELQLLKSWAGAHWRVISPNEVIIDQGSDHMLLRFDDQLDQFTTKDWDGKQAKGHRKDTKPR